MMSREDLRARLTSGPGIMVAAVTGLFLLGFVVTYIGPLQDKSLSAFDSQSLGYSEASLAGKQVYDSENCASCHTQQVRAVSNDIGLGQVTKADRAVRDAPSEFGMARVGPDLACFGDRPTARLTAYLKDPRSVLSTSKMPRYSYLSESEIAQLSAYLKSLTCAKGGK